MWKCKKCGAVVEDSFDSCCRCGTPVDVTSPRIAYADEKPLTVSSITTDKLQQSQHTGGLDFRKLSNFIALFGIAVACYGGFQAFKYLPLTEPPPDSGQFKGWGDFMNKTLDPTKNAIGVALINSDRARARTEAYKVIGFGAVIVFAGIAIGRSARR